MTWRGENNPQRNERKTKEGGKKGQMCTCSLLVALLKFWRVNDNNENDRNKTSKKAKFSVSILYLTEGVINIIKLLIAVVAEDLIHMD